MEFYRYAGDIKRLKKIGYTFQRLYARNYISYHKGEIFMFKTSKMILEIGQLPSEYQTLAIKFILDNKDKPDTWWQHESNHKKLFGDTKFATWSLIDGIIYNQDMKRQAYKAGHEMIIIRDGFRFEYELVKQILELEPLEKITLEEK